MLCSQFLAQGVKSAGMARSKERRSSPAEVAKKGPPCDIKDVQKEWDKDEEIRKRLREGGTFLGPNSVIDAESIKNAVINKDLLMPLLGRVCSRQATFANSGGSSGRNQ